MALNAHGVEYSSSSSCSKTIKTYDVFLSFRGEDTRKGFTGNLYEALRQNGLETFRDDEELERGEVIKPSLLQAIEDSLSAIVVLSENYATSRWCLDELLKILHSQKELGLHVFPIFYGVDPTDVRHQRGSFGEAFKQLEQKFAYDQICIWMDALKKVADFSGWDSRNYRYESKLIEDVVEGLGSKLYVQPPLNSNDDGLVGIDVKIAKVDSVVASESEDVKFIGIWGMGGLGKTTLARAFYERRKKNYALYFFLPNVREKSATTVGLVELQQKLFSPMKMEVGDCVEGKKLIERRLRNRKVLLVLDDVNDIRQLKNLAGKKGWFGKKSRILITTRDQRLLSLHGVDFQYKMNFLTNDESRQLFLQKAFKGGEPDKDYSELSQSVIESAKGLPLAIEVFGSFICERTKAEWKDALKKIHSSDDSLFHILKVSFDGLGDNEKEMFLDIACFYNGWPQKIVKQVLENIGLLPEIGIKILIEKSLVTEDEGYLWVHDTLQEMGEKIVFEESRNDAGERSRIWSMDDWNHVLGNKRGTKAIRGMVARSDKPYVIHLDPEAFSNMSNLKLLIILRSSSAQLKLLYGLTYLSNTLKVIIWEGYPLDSLPSQSQLNELIYLKMRESKLKELWTGAQFLRSLTIMDLSHSANLIRTPNFDEIPNLQTLHLMGCTKLVEVHHSIGQHKNLVMVNFRDCQSIETLPIKFDMNSLEIFVLRGCSKVKRIPEFGEGMGRLSELNLQGTAIFELPQSLVNLIGLAILNLRGCKNLVCLPNDFQKLKAIRKICIAECPRILKLPEKLNENEALVELRIGGTAIQEMPLSLNSLEYLSLWGCKSLFSSSKSFLWSNISNMSSLVTLNLCDCNLDDESLPSVIGNLSSLTSLYLGTNYFVEFPFSLISKLQKLEHLDVSNCQGLRSLPQLPSNVLLICATDCPLLEHYVQEQQLWEFIAQFDSHQTRCHATKLLDDESTLYYIGAAMCFSVQSWEAQVPDFFMQPTRSLNIIGNEVPEWFYNQDYFCDEDFPYVDSPTNVSFKVNMRGSSELWGIAVCLVLEQDSKYMKLSNSFEICWTYRYSDNEYSKSHYAYWIYPQHSCLRQQCIIYTRFSSFVAKDLQMVFFVEDYDSNRENLPIKIVKCGWRLLSKKDVDKWQNTRNE